MITQKFDNNERQFAKDYGHSYQNMDYKLAIHMRITSYDILYSTQIQYALNVDKIQCKTRSQQQGGWTCPSMDIYTDTDNPKS